MTDNTGEFLYKFTVFTATYNRAHSLSRVYESLQAQTYRDFEWLIVDDGSTDETRTLVESWQSKADFPIRYVWQENQGKHVAFNLGVKMAQGEFFQSADSDDSFLPTALEIFKKHWDAIGDEQKPLFVGVTGLCINENHQIVGDKFPNDIFDSSNLEKRYVHKISGEKWGFSRTEILREFPFPEAKGMKFIPENVVWSPIARKYKTRYVNEVVRIYHINDATNDQLSRSKDYSAISPGASLMHKCVLNDEIQWFRYAPKDFLRSAVAYIRYSLHAKMGFYRQISQLNNTKARLLWCISLPLGCLIYLKDKLKGK